MEVSTTVLFPWILTVLQILGLLSAWLVRCSEGSRHETRAQWFFFACMGAVGIATLVAFGAAHGAWCFSGATLGGMVVMITCETRGGAEHQTR